jgi:hypothetical protein
MTLPRDVLGVDVAKNWIDVFAPATGSRQRVATTQAALAGFAEAAAGAFVVFEGEPDQKSIQWIDFPVNGGDERPLAAALAQAGLAFARVNPRQARDFARATGRLGPRPTGSMRRSSPAWARRSISRRPRRRSPTAPGSPTSSPAATTSAA